MSRIWNVRRTWYRLLRVGPLVLLLAFLPSFRYIDHWGEFLAYTFAGAPIEAEVEAPLDHSRHEAHCHYGPSSCSDQPVAAGVRVIPVLFELLPPELASVRLEGGLTLLEGAAVAPPTEPPRA